MNTTPEAIGLWGFLSAILGILGTVVTMHYKAKIDRESISVKTDREILEEIRRNDADELKQLRKLVAEHERTIALHEKTIGAYKERIRFLQDRNELLMNQLKGVQGGTVG